MPWHWEPMKDVISCGELQISIDPQISEWGNPHGLISVYHILNKIGI